MEVEAIRQVVQLCGRYKVPCHIVHLSSSEAIPIIDQAVKDGLPITVETCPHYLTLLAEQVPSGCTQFKCCPPIRNKDNQVGILSITPEWIGKAQLSNRIDSGKAFWTE